MDDRTLAALNGSIAKWQKIVDGVGQDQGAANCPLCQKFAKPSLEVEGWCAGCPVSDAVNAASCHRTPYDAWDEHREYDAGCQEYRHNHESYVCPVCKTLAEAELEFLKSLLPVGYE